MFCLFPRKGESLPEVLLFERALVIFEFLFRASFVATLLKKYLPLDSD